MSSTTEYDTYITCTYALEGVWSTVCTGRPVYYKTHPVPNGIRVSLCDSQDGPEIWHAVVQDAGASVTLTHRFNRIRIQVVHEAEADAEADAEEEPCCYVTLKYEGTDYNYTIHNKSSSSCYFKFGNLSTNSIDVYVYSDMIGTLLDTIELGNGRTVTKYLDGEKMVFTSVVPKCSECHAQLVVRLPNNTLSTMCSTCSI